MDEVVAARLAAALGINPAVVRRIKMAHKFKYGATVIIPWGIDEVRATVSEVYGPDDDRRVVVILSPELSSYVVDQDTTMSLPVGSVRPARLSVGEEGDSTFTAERSSAEKLGPDSLAPR